MKHSWGSEFHIPVNAADLLYFLDDIFAKSFRSPSLALSNMLFLVIGPYAFSKASDSGGITNFLSILRRTVRIWDLIYNYDFLQYIEVAFKNSNQCSCCTVGITAALLPIAQGVNWHAKQSGKFYFGKLWFFRADIGQIPAIQHLTGYFPRLPIPYRLAVASLMPCIAFTIDYVCKFYAVSEMAACTRTSILLVILLRRSIWLT